MFDGGEYVSLAGEFNEFRKVIFVLNQNLLNYWTI